jgi:UDP-glucose 4-epimerase
LGRALVTGGAGFIGSHLVDALLDAGSDVCVLDDLSTGSRDNLARALRTGRVDLRVASVVDQDAAETAARGCDRIFHLAATVGVRKVLADPVGGLRNNILGTDSILRAARKTRPSVIVLFSSSEVYGRTSGGPLPEISPTILGPTSVPRWSYAAGKSVSEYLALGEHRRSGLPVVIVRCFNTCGPRQVDSHGMVIPSFLRRALRGDPLMVYGDGEQTRCFSFVGDVVRGVLSLSSAPLAVGEVFNIGSDEEVTILDLAARVARACGSASSIQVVPYEEAYGPGFEDVPRRVPDLGKIRRVIGYEALTDLDGLLATTRDWIRSREWSTISAPVPGS